MRIDFLPLKFSFTQFFICTISSVISCSNAYFLSNLSCYPNLPCVFNFILAKAKFCFIVIHDLKVVAIDGIAFLLPKIELHNFHVHNFGSAISCSNAYFFIQSITLSKPSILIKLVNTNGFPFRINLASLSITSRLAFT